MPFPFVVGVTLLQPRKNSPVVVETLKRGDPPWHWLVLASANDADSNARPLTPVTSAPAAAFVASGQFFSRCSVFVFLMYVDLTQPVLPGSKTPGTSAAEAAAVKASVSARTPATKSFFMPDPPLSLGVSWDTGPLPGASPLRTPIRQALRDPYGSFVARSGDIVARTASLSEIWPGRSGPASRDRGGRVIELVRFEQVPRTPHVHTVVTRRADFAVRPDGDRGDDD